MHPTTMPWGTPHPQPHLIGLLGIWYMADSPGRSLLMYMAHWICRKSQFSIMFTMGSPRSRPCKQARAARGPR
jgi:hypothetical protein